jgi:rubrerythrin
VSAKFDKDAAGWNQRIAFQRPGSDGADDDAAYCVVCGVKMFWRAGKWVCPQCGYCGV